MASERERIAYELCRAMPELSRCELWKAVDVVQREAEKAFAQGMERAAEIAHEIAADFRKRAEAVLGGFELSCNARGAAAAEKAIRAEAERQKGQA